MELIEIEMFVPVFNEREILRDNVKRIIDVMEKVSESFRITLVDDNSTDGSFEIMKEMADKDERIGCVLYKNGPSRRENLARAFLNSNAKIIGYMDIDLATDINKLGDLINYIRYGHDIAIGSRYKGIRPEREFGRLLLSKIYNGIMKYGFGSRIQDHQCGFKAFRKDCIFDLVNKVGYDKSFTRGWFWDAQILIEAQKRKYKIKEFPVRWIRGEKSSFNFKREAKILLYVFLYRMGIR